MTDWKTAPDIQNAESVGPADVRPAYCFECDDTSRCASAELCYAQHKDFPKLETTGMPKSVQKTDDIQNPDSTAGSTEHVPDSTAHSLAGIKVICSETLPSGTMLVSPDIYEAIKISPCVLERKAAEAKSHDWLDSLGRRESVRFPYTPKSIPAGPTPAEDILKRSEWAQDRF